MKASTILSTLFALALGGALAAPAQASGWVVGADFSVGGVNFSLGYHDTGRHYGPYRPSPYYRSTPRFAVRGARCSSACYIDRGHAYHHSSCPVVSAHFGRHRFDPYPIWHRIGWYGGHQPGYSYRYDRYRSWDRHDRGRGRGHDHGHGHHRGRGRGHSSCRHH